MQIFCNLPVDIRTPNRLLLIAMNSASHKESFQEICIRALRQDGARVTHARVSVIDALAPALRPMTVKDVMAEVRRSSSKDGVDLVSIYRTLDKLIELNLVHRVSPSGSFLPCHHAACGHDRHVMMRCRECACIKECDVSEAAMLPLLGFLRQQHGFEAEARALQVDGVCEDCR